jgi:hypothetical protein
MKNIQYNQSSLIPTLLFSHLFITTSRIDLILPAQSTKEEDRFILLSFFLIPPYTLPTCAA